MINLLKKSANNNTKTAVRVTPNQKATTTVANISSKVKTGAFGVATGAGIAGTMMLQNEKNIRNRKARAEYHKKVEAVCTVAVGAAVVGAGAAIVQSIFDPVIDVSMLEIEPAAYVELNDKGSEIQEKAAQKSEAAEPVEDEDAAEAVSEQNTEQPAEKVVAEIVQTEQPAPASAPKAEQPVVEATATEVKSEQTPAAPATPVDPATVTSAPVDPAAAPAPVDPAPVAQTNQGNSQPKGQNGNNSSKSNNNHAKAAK